MTRRSCLAAVIACVCLTATGVWGDQYYRYEPRLVTPPDQTQTEGGVLVKEMPIQQGDTLYDLSRKFSGKGFYYPQILLFNDIKDPNKIYAGDLIKIPVGQNVSDAKNISALSDTSTISTKKASSSKKKQKRTVAHSGSKQTKSEQKTGTAELTMSDLQHLGGTEKQPRTSAKRISRAERKTIKQPFPRSSAVPDSAQTTTHTTAEHANIPSQEEAIRDVSSGQMVFERALKAFRQDNYTTALELFDRFLTENPDSPLAADANLYKAECYLKQSGL